jgi:hypothetical protein
VVETNIDDAPAEVVADAAARLMAAGALDVYTVPITMKKGRSAVLLACLAHEAERPRCEELLFEHTGTFGVRRHLCSRSMLGRRHETVRTRYGEVRVKVGLRGASVVRVAPEFEDCRRVAEAAGVSVRAPCSIFDIRRIRVPRTTRTARGTMISLATTLLADGNWLQDNVLFTGLLIVGVSVIMLVVTRRRIARNRAAGDPPAIGPAPRSPVTGREQSRDASQSMREMMLELEQLSREINSQVDTRLRALNLLVQEADEKLRQLRELQGLAEGEGPQVRRLPPLRQEPHPEATSERYARVYTLAEKGHSIVEIARELEMMTGEVELILALRRSAGERRPEGRA